MHSSPPFPHVQRAREHSDETANEKAEREVKQWFLLAIVFICSIFALISYAKRLSNEQRHPAEHGTNSVPTLSHE